MRNAMGSGLLVLALGFSAGVAAEETCAPDEFGAISVECDDGGGESIQSVRARGNSGSFAIATLPAGSGDEGSLLARFAERFADALAGQDER